MNDENWKTWFGITQKEFAAMSKPRARLVCFHSAGSDHTMFTAEMIRRKPAPNELVKFCKEHSIQLLCPVLPGRSHRCRESCAGLSIGDLAYEVFTLIEPLIRDEKPLFLAGHSMGGALLFEFAKRVVRDAQLAKHLKAVFISSSLSATSPKTRRPWRPVKTLTSQELKNDMAEWDIAEEALQDNIWKSFEPMIFADMNLLDEYPQQDPIVFKEGQIPSLILIRGEFDRRITPDMVEEWENAFLPKNSVSPEVNELEGSHAIFYEQHSRSQWNGLVTKKMSEYLQDSNDDDDSDDDFVTGF